MGIFRFIARPLLASPFIYTGIKAALAPQEHREQIDNLEFATDTLGVTLEDQQKDLVARGVGIAQVTAGCLLSIGKFQRLSGAVLAATQIPSVVGANPIWKLEGDEKKDAKRNLLTGIGLAGGALLAAVDRKGQPSLGYRYSQWRDHREELAEIRADARQRVKEAKNA